MIILFSRNFNSSFFFYSFSLYDHIKVIVFLVLVADCCWWLCEHILEVGSVENDEEENELEYLKYASSIYEMKKIKILKVHNFFYFFVNYGKNVSRWREVNILRKYFRNVSNVIIVKLPCVVLAVSSSGRL